MQYPLTVIVLAVSAFLAAGQVHAEYVGPSSVPRATAQQLTAQGRDDQHAVLHGRLVSHDGGKHYTFEDGSGRIAVELSPRLMPAGRKIDAQTPLELTGKLDRDFSKLTFEVKQLRFVE